MLTQRGGRSRPLAPESHQGNGESRHQPANDLQRDELERKFRTLDVETRTVLAATELTDTSQILPLLQRLDTK